MLVHDRIRSWIVGVAHDWNNEERAEILFEQGRRFGQSLHNFNGRKISYGIAVKQKQPKTNKLVE